MNNESFSYDLFIGIFVYIVFSIYFLFYSIKDKNVTLIFFTQILLLFVLLIIINGASYMFNVDVTASIKNIFSPIGRFPAKARS